MWPRAISTCPPTRGTWGPIVEPGTITDALKSANLVLRFVLERCAFEAFASGDKTGSCLPRGGLAIGAPLVAAVVWRGRCARGDGDSLRPRTNRAAAPGLRRSLAHPFALWAASWRRALRSSS